MKEAPPTSIYTPIHPLSPCTPGLFPVRSAVLCPHPPPQQLMGFAVYNPNGNSLGVRTNMAANEFIQKLQEAATNPTIKMKYFHNKYSLIKTKQISKHEIIYIIEEINFTSKCILFYAKIQTRLSIYKM